MSLEKKDYWDHNSLPLSDWINCVQRQLLTCGSIPKNIVTENFFFYLREITARDHVASIGIYQLHFIVRFSDHIAEIGSNRTNEFMVQGSSIKNIWPLLHW